MTAVAHHAPSTVDMLGAVTDLLCKVPPLDDPDISVHVRRIGATGIHLYITSDYGPAAHRRAHIAALGMTLNSAMEYRAQGPVATEGLWGTLHVTGAYAGAPMYASTPLTRREARALGYAVCADCGHGDHDDDAVCLAATVNEHGFETHCACGPDPVEPVVADLTETQRLHLTLVAERSDWDDDAREACDMDAYDVEADRVEAERCEL